MEYVRRRFLRNVPVKVFDVTVILGAGLSAAALILFGLLLPQEWLLLPVPLLLWAVLMRCGAIEMWGID